MFHGNSREMIIEYTILKNLINIIILSLVILSIHTTNEFPFILAVMLCHFHLIITMNGCTSKEEELKHISLTLDQVEMIIDHWVHTELTSKPNSIQNHWSYSTKNQNKIIYQYTFNNYIGIPVIFLNDNLLSARIFEYNSKMRNNSSSTHIPQFRQIDNKYYIKLDIYFQNHCILNHENEIDIKDLRKKLSITEYLDQDRMIQIQAIVFILDIHNIVTLKFIQICIQQTINTMSTDNPILKEIIIVGVNTRSDHHIPQNNDKQDIITDLLWRYSDLISYFEIGRDALNISQESDPIDTLLPKWIDDKQMK